jgi:hypothetical protein
MRLRRRVPGVVPRIFVLTLLLSGGAARASNDACDLLTTAEVTRLVSASLRPGEHLGSSNKTVCGWSVSTPPKLDEPRVAVAIKTLESFNAGKDLKEIKREPAPGVGDEAWFTTFGSGGTTLSVRKGDRAFSVKVLGSKLKQEDLKQLEKNLALLILPRL